MYGWIFKRVGWKFFAAGAATAVVGGGMVRPALVSLAKVGLGAQSLVSNAWQEAKAETSKVFAEASSMRTAATTDISDVANQLKMLREDVASLKTQIASR